MSAPPLRCLAVWSTATAIALALTGWLAPAAATPGPGLDTALVRLFAAIGTLAAAWLWIVATVVTVEALRGRSGRGRAIPLRVRRVVLAACGAAVAAGLATPADAAPDRSDPPQTAASVVAAALDGLPLPDRAHGSAHRHAAATPRSVTVRPGDSLWAIAEDRLGAGDRWPEIYALNRAVVGADPDLIEPAQRLRLPHLSRPHSEETR